MPFVKGYGRLVVHRHLQQHGTASLFYQPFLCSREQLRAHVGTLKAGMDVNGENVPRARRVRFGNDEAGNLAGSIACVLSYQGEGPAAPHVPGELAAGIRDSRRKAGLVNAPQLVEVVYTIGADEHRKILAGSWEAAVPMADFLFLIPRSEATRNPYSHQFSS